MARTVLITGCSDGGLGAALAVAFHRHGGYRVLATARNPAKMASLAALDITTLPLDVCSDESIAACVAEVSKLTGGSLDMLINNAGGGYNMPLLDVAPSEVMKQFDLNVLSIIRMTQQFVHLLRESRHPHGALIANNTSLNSILPLPFQGPYSAAKAAAGSISECLRLELQVFNIQVVDLKTARVQSGFFDNHGTLEIPSGSLYSDHKEVVEKTMNEGPELGGITAEVWAGQIVSDLSRSRPSPIITRGEGGLMGRLAASLPVGFGPKDSSLKKLTRLDQVEKKAQTQKKTK